MYGCGIDVVQNGHDLPLFKFRRLHGPRGIALADLLLDSLADLRPIPYTPKCAWDTVEWKGVNYPTTTVAQLLWEWLCNVWSSYSAQRNSISFSASPNCPGVRATVGDGPVYFGWSCMSFGNLVCGWQQTLILKPYCQRFWPCTATATERESHLCALGSAIFATPLWRIFWQGFLRYRESSKHVSQGTKNRTVLTRQMKCGVVFRFPNMPVIQQSLILQKIVWAVTHFFLTLKYLTFCVQWTSPSLDTNSGLTWCRFILARPRPPESVSQVLVIGWNSSQSSWWMQSWNHLWIFAGKTHFHKPFYHFLSCLLKHGQSSVHV